MTTKLPFPTRAEAEELTRLAQVRICAERKAKREEVECALSKRVDEFMVDLGDGIRNACSIGCNYHDVQYSFVVPHIYTYPGDLHRFVKDTIHKKVFQANGFDGVTEIQANSCVAHIKVVWGQDSL